MYKRSKFSRISWLLLFLLTGCANHKIHRQDIASPKYSADIFLNRGVDYIRKNKPELAKEEFGKALQTDPNYFNAYFYRGKVNSGQGFYEQAIRDFTQALKLNPENRKAYFARGQAFSLSGQYRNAVTDFSTLLSLSRYYRNAHLLRAHSYRELAEYDLALADYAFVSKANPKDVWPLLLIGEIMGKKGLPDEALRYFNKAVKKNPGFAKCYLYRGNYYLGQKKYDSALADFDKLIKISKYDPEAYYKRALTLENSGRTREALTSYQQFLQLASRQNPLLSEVKARMKDLE